MFFPVLSPGRSRRAALGTVATVALLVVPLGSARADEAPAGSSGSPASGRNELISARPDGHAASGRSYAESVSADGRYVAFQSAANDVVGGHSSIPDQVYVRDRQTGATVMVSQTPSGRPGNGNSGSAAISADGRYVAYVSSATNLAERVSDTGQDILRTDLQTMETVRITHALHDRPPRTPLFGHPTMSGDGSLVAYETDSKGMVRGDRRHSDDVFMYSVDSGETVFVSRSVHGGVSDGESNSPSISAAGTTIAFDSSSTDIAEGHGPTSDIVVFDVATKTNRLLTRGDAASDLGEISADGRVVAFSSYATNLVEGVSPSDIEAYVVDVATAAVSLVSLGADGEPADAAAFGTSVSDDGRLVAFDTDASNVVPGGGNGLGQQFVRDMSTGTTVLVSHSRHGEPGNGASGSGTLSADGSVVAYSSGAGDLVRRDTNKTGDAIAYRIS